MIAKTACVVLFLIAATTVTQIAADESLSSKSFVFKKTEQTDLSLKAYFPPDWKPSQAYPAIVFFFGGGWNSGSTRQFEPQAEYFANRGMVAVCADYRVKSRHKVSPDVCVEDAKSAVRWVRQNAKTLGVDPDRIVGSGGSAGAHLAACTGICDSLDSQEEDQGVSSKPNVLVLFNPVLDLKSAKHLAQVGSNAELARAISPAQHLKKESPPTLILFGTDDPLLAQGREFINRSRELGHHAELYLANGVGHSFFNKSPWLEKTIHRVDEFLTSIGYLTTPIKSGAGTE